MNQKYHERTRMRWRPLLLWALDNGSRRAAVISKEREPNTGSVGFPTILNAFGVEVVETLKVVGGFRSVNIVP